MDFWIAFVLVTLLVHFAHLHYRAWKRIRALEKEVEEIYQYANDHMDISIQLTKLVAILVDRSTQDGQEIIAIRANLMKLKQEKS